jgi:hypothetical protein
MANAPRKTGTRTATKRSQSQRGNQNGRGNRGGPGGGGGGSLQALTLPQLKQWHKSYMLSDKLITNLQEQQQIQKPFILAMAKIHGENLDFTPKTTGTRGTGTRTATKRGTRVRATGNTRQNNQQFAANG